MKFYPDEIIFAATEACNLHCPHCFVSRNPDKLDVSQSINFINSWLEASSKNPDFPALQKIGFSGGEPFLYFDFIMGITNHVIEKDLMFDQIMTNGDWWQDKIELTTKLQVLYDAGYDGKFGLSWDIFHGQKTERMITFINAVQELFGPDSLNIQSVIPDKALFKKDKDSRDYVDKKAYKAQLKDIKKAVKRFNIKIYYLPQSFPSSQPLAWQSKKWFKEDYCEGPGQILYIHPDGNIAPCCGFANENPELFIGKITDNFESVMKNAKNNRMVKTCYEKGLSVLTDTGLNFPGKCNDICTFCDYVCKHL